MHITNLSISGFGNFNKLISLDFPPDQIGLILGNNETGKSTIVAAIFAVFYGLKPVEKKLWQSWELNGEFRIKICFNHAGNSYVLDRDLEKNLVNLKLVSENEKIFYNDYHLPSERFDRIYFNAYENIFPLPVRSILESTAIVHENQLAIKTDAHLRQLITGTVETDYEDVLLALEEEYYQITKERLPWQKHGGRRVSQLIEEKEQLLNKREKEYQESLQYFNEQRTIQQNLLTVESQRKKLEQKIPLFNKLLVKIKLIEKLQDRINQFETQKSEILEQLMVVENLVHNEEKLRQKIKTDYVQLLPFDTVNLEKEITTLLSYIKRETELENRCEELQTEIDMIKAEQDRLPDFADVPDNFLYILQEIQNQDAEIPELKKNLKEIKIQLDTKHRKLKGRIVLSLIWFLVAFCSGIASFLFIPFEFWGWALTVLAFFSGIFFTFAEVIPAFKKRKNDKDEFNKIQILLNKTFEFREMNYKSIKKFLNNNNFEEVKTHYRRYRDLQKRIDNTNLLLESTTSDISKVKEEKENKELSAKYDKVIDKNIDLLQEEIVHFRKDKNQLYALSQKLEAVPKYSILVEKKESFIQKISTLELEKKEIFNKYPVIKNLLETSDIESLILRIEKENNETVSKLNNLEKQITNYRIHLHQNSSIKYDPEQINEEITFLGDQINFLNKRKAALRLALEILRESVNEFRNSHLDVLNNGIQEILTKIIKPLKYTVKLDANFQFDLSYKNLPVSVDQLSSGTRDQLFFAYRLVLNEFLAPNINFPLIIDDAFVHYDQKRTKNIFAILKKIKKTHQILIFSSNSDYKKMCDYVINLDDSSQ